MTVDGSAHLDAIRLESERFSRAARGPIDARVPSCPDWVLADLIWHLGEVQWFWSEVVRTRTSDPKTLQRSDRPSDAELPSWFDGVSVGLVDVLSSTDPTTRVWSWAGGEQDVTWVLRRQAHEAAVHRWDAQRSIGEPEPIAAALAADGIDEFFEWMFDPEEARGFEGSVGVQLTPTDADRTWVVSVRDGRIDLVADAAMAEVTVRASTSDLLLLMWRRVVPDDVRVEGDRSALERFLSIVDLS